MEPITLTAATIAALIITGAANKVGESLVEGGFNGFNYVREKFKERNKEGLLVLAKEQPEELQAELISQMEEDPQYKEHVEQFLQSIGITYQTAVGILEAEETIEIEDIDLEDYGSRLLQQIGIKDARAKNIKIGKIHVKSEKKTLDQ